MVRQFEFDDVREFGMMRKKEYEGFRASYGAIKVSNQIENYNTILRALSHFDRDVTAKEIADFLNEQTSFCVYYNGCPANTTKKWKSRNVAGMMKTLCFADLVTEGKPILIEGKREEKWEYGELVGWYVPLWKIKTYHLTGKAKV